MKSSALIHVAIADEHLLIRHAIRKLIESFGIDVCIEADNGRELIEKLEKASRLPDICIVDVNMPEMNGYETVERIRAKWNDINILVLSFYSSESSIIKMMKMGARGYLIKDCEPFELQKAITEIYHNGFYHSQFFNGRHLYSLLNNTHFSADLSDVELGFLSLCATQLTYKEIAGKMAITARLAETYRYNLFEKLNVKTRVGLAVYAFNMGLMPRS
jgi:two-component system, NarL family, invasion response regulator UvrY